MMLKEAMRRARANNLRTGEPTPVHLACGFTAEPLKVFLCAALSELAPDRRIVCEAGPYGDLALALKPLAPHQAVAVVLEWPDVDPRLGYRRLGGWRRDGEADLLRSAEMRLAEIEEAIRQLAAEPGRQLALSPPTLPLPPAFMKLPGQGSAAEWSLRTLIAGFCARCATLRGVRVASPERIDAMSPVAGRHDIRSELASDFPYSLDHAAAVAAQLAGLLRPRSPLKGLITDLDDTLWRGLVGEAGADAVAWDLDGRAQMHGVYQQLLAALADEGVLIALASKNEESRVAEALARSDLKIGADRFFPIEAGWHAKPLSVERILKAWNVGPESVVFVDDSVIELAEVAVSYPAMRCLRFPAQDEVAALALVMELRDLFGREEVGEEDQLRRESLRAMATAGAERQTAGSRDGFLAALDSKLSANFGLTADEGRALELLNKTNQFNLNGLRLDRAEWATQLASPGAFALLVSYSDKFGDLGRVSAVLGRREAGGAKVSHWVLSCRAFGRRIEHQTLALLFDELQVERMELDFRPTERNRLFGAFLSALGVDPDGRVVLDRGTLVRAPLTFHAVTVIG